MRAILICTLLGILCGNAKSIGRSLLADGRNLSIVKPGQHLIMIHIPKTAATSLKKELHANSIGIKQGYDEYCYLERKYWGGFLLTFLRAPRAHVYSQYLECRYDDFGKKQTAGTSFPRDVDDVTGVSQWIEHFHNDWNPKKGDYNCYNPRNMQTRVLTCVNHRWDLHHEPVYVAGEQFVNRQNAALTHINEIDWVGITEFYHESWCLLLHQLKRELPVDCGQCEAANNITHVHDTHHVPKHDPNDIPVDVLKKIDSLTTSDVEVYIEGLKRFCYNIQTLYQQSGKKVLCRSKVEKFKKATEYLVGLWKNETNYIPCFDLHAPNSMIS